MPFCSCQCNVLLVKSNIFAQQNKYVICTQSYFVSVCETSQAKKKKLFLSGQMVNVLINYFKEINCVLII